MVSRCEVWDWFWTIELSKVTRDTCIYAYLFPSTSSHSVRLLSLVFEMARYSTSFMLQLVQMNATELLTYLLEKVVKLIQQSRINVL